MRVLIVTYNYLSGFGGGVYGARACINAFAAFYDDVTLLYPARSEVPGIYYRYKEQPDSSPVQQ